MIGIKGMEMPKNCDNCRFFDDDWGWCFALQASPTPDKECPLVDMSGMEDDLK